MTGAVTETADSETPVRAYLEDALERWRGEVLELGDLRAGAALAGRVEHAIRMLRGED